MLHAHGMIHPSSSSAFRHSGAPHIPQEQAREQVRIIAREEAERVALANARKVRNEDVARRKLFARAKTHPWEFLDPDDPDGTKAERKRRNRRVVRKPGSESLPAIRVRL